MSSSLSSLRAKLRDAQQQLPGLLELCFGRDSLLPGCVYKLRRKCGKPNCHCAEGKPHEGEVLSYRGDGRAKNVSLPVAELDRARTMTAEYQRVRKVRAKFVRWQQKVLALLDAMEEARVQSGKSAFERLLAKKD